MKEYGEKMEKGMKREMKEERGERVLKGGNIAEAAKYAESARMARDHEYMAPKGPAKEPVKINNVPMLPDRGVSK